MSTKIRTMVSRIVAMVASLAALIIAHQTSARATPASDAVYKGQLKDFLFDLMKDPAKLVAFRENPDAALAGTRLSAEEKAALKSGDASRIQELLAQADPSAAGGAPIVRPPPLIITRMTDRPTPSPNGATKPPKPKE